MDVGRARCVLDRSMSGKSGLSSGQAAAALGLHRFGFGPVGDSIAAIAADPPTARCWPILSGQVLAGLMHQI